MAKKRKSQQHRVEGARSGTPTTPIRSARTSRRQPPARRRMLPYWIGGGVAIVLVLLIGAFAFGFIPGFGPGVGSPTAGTGQAACQLPEEGRPMGPPEVAPLANPPAQPVSDGTRARIETEEGTIVVELYCASAPVAAQNFVNLGASGYYEDVVFHRIIPGFMIQGGDPEGTGRGGPGYTIPDERVVGDYTRGTLAMARTALPNSQGSQFFIVVADSPHLRGGGYTIFGRVVEGMEVADAIVAGPRTGPQDDLAAEPVAITQVIISHPGP